MRSLTNVWIVVDVDLMSTELLSPKLDELELQEIKEDAVLPDMQQEMECPRCLDNMTLFLGFVLTIEISSLESP
jgi:hypothetical protein